jgi:valyl-tRNA synthetase
VGIVQNIILAVRNIRGEMNISPNKSLDIIVGNADATQQQIINDNAKLLQALAKLSTLTWLPEGSKPPVAATALAANMQIFIPMQGLIDKVAEVSRLNKEIEKISKDADKLSEKLANSSYVDKAPAEVVAKDKERLSELQQALARLKGSLAAVEQL